MPKKIKSPIAIVTLETTNNVQISTPLGLFETVRVNLPSATLAAHLAKSWHKYWIEDGDYLEVVRMLPPALSHQAKLAIEFKSGHASLHYPNTFSLALHACYCQLATDCFLGFLPELGIESMASSQEKLEEALISNAQLEFVRKGRGADARGLVEIAWYEEVAWHSEPVELTFYTQIELDNLSEHQEHSLLETLSSKLSSTSAQAFGLAAQQQQLKDLLAGGFSQSVLLVGPNGCGKTALLNHFAREWKKCHAKPILETTAARLIQALTRGSGWQQNLALLCRELQAEGTLLYVNHLSELFEVGQYQGNAVSLGEALREPLQRGEITLLAEATEEELASLDLRAPGTCALFHQLRFPNRAETEEVAIVHQAVAALARAHRVEVSQDGIEEIIFLHRRYSPYSGFPGKTIRFLEALILHEKNRPDFQPAQRVDQSKVIEAFCLESAMPKSIVDEAVLFDQKAARDFFQARLFGQDEAIEIMIELLAAIKTGLLRAGKPIANLLFVGPTGVGKTEMAKTLAQFLFSDPERLLRLDMSEYADPEAVLRITGDSCGTEASLVTRVRQQPFSVVLLDEIEKADPNFFDLLLQILGEGRLTDGRGQTANFCSTLIIMTANLGAEGFHKTAIGFTEHCPDHEAVAQHFKQAVQDFFRPELFNRLDRLVAFNPLGAADQPRIIDRQLKLLRQRAGIKDRKLPLTLTPETVTQLGHSSYDPRYGARQMKRNLHQKLVVPLARALNGFARSQTLELTIQEGATELTVQATESMQDHHTGDPSRITLAMDRVSTLRRHYQAILEGPIQITFENDLEQLENRKKRLQQRFWSEEVRAKEYKTHNQTKQESQQLGKQILNMETRLTLAMLSIDEQNPPTGQEIQTWEQHHLAHKIDLYQQVEKQAAYCVLGLYGPLAQQKILQSLYQKIFQSKGFSVNTFAIFLREESYLRATLPIAKGDPLAHQDPIGLEFAIQGNCPYLFLLEEAGLWQWKNAAGNRAECYIAVKNCTIEQFTTPEKVHRRTFLETASLTRSISQGQLQAKQGKLKVPFPNADALRLALEQRFRKRLDRELL